MSATTKFLAMGTLLVIMLVGVLPVMTTAFPFGPSQVVAPFEEMLPGVYVAYEWWNDSGKDWGDEIYPTYPAEPGETVTAVPGDPGTGTGDQTDPGYYPPYMPYIYVEDVDSNVYWIQEDYVYDYSYNWSFSNLLVVVVLDPDASYMSWLSGVNWFVEPTATDIWGLMWYPESVALTGDEVFIYSTFYLSEYNSSYYYSANYTWYDDGMNPVDANDVIPNLKEEYAWAAWMNESYEYDYEGSFTSYGFDISEMFNDGETSQWMDHYFSGLSAFNDTNGNGIMDIVYDPIEMDYDEDGIVDWVYYEMNATASELVYDFYAESAELGNVVLPQLNDEQQIEWSAEVVDIDGNLMTAYPYPEPIWCFCGTDAPPEEIVEPETVPTAVDRLEMVYRFEVTDEAAVLKVDQHFGDFTNPETGVILPEVDGLSLAAKYWSSFSSYTITGELYDGTEVGMAMPESAPAPEGTLRFEEVREQETDLRTTIEFGGTYLWGKDGGTYDVGTAIIPTYFYAMPFAEQGAPAADLAFGADMWYMQTYYYASCYAEWDGHAITHDPIFTVFPLSAPGPITSLIGLLTNSAILIGAVGVVAIAVVCVRVNNERKSL
jgi:hypothetical protein